MKKLLALVLALVMTLSLATVGTNAFKDDAKINPDYDEAVQVLNGMGVFKGYEDGEFKPLNDITRAEVAAIVYRIYTGDVADKQASIYAGYGKFDDVNTAAWYAGYVGYCTNAGFIKGYGDGKFGPNDKVTGYQALAMILRAVGYGKNGEFEGKDWELHVAQVAQQIGALKNVKGESLKAAASRQLVAELLFQCTKAATVIYTPALGYTATTLLVNNSTNRDTVKPGGVHTTSLGYQNFKLVCANTRHDAWGRPSYSWIKEGTRVVYHTFNATPVKTYTTPVTECDVAADLGLKADTKVARLTVNANVVAAKNLKNFFNGDDAISVLATKKTIGEQGRLTEIYENEDGDYEVVMIDTFLARVNSVTEVKYDRNQHISKEATLSLTVFDRSTNSDKATGTNVKLTDKTNWEYAEGDWILLYAQTVNENAQNVLVPMEVYELLGKADSMKGVQTKYSNKAVHIIDDKTYDDAYQFNLDQAGNMSTQYTWFFDTYGNLIGAVKIATVYNYGVISAIRWVDSFSNENAVAQATITYMDGTADTAVVYGIQKEGSDKVTVLKGDKISSYAAGIVSEYRQDNVKEYRNKALYRITETSKGLLLEETTKLGPDAYTKKGEATIDVDKAMATKTTKYLVWNGSGYDTYTGYQNIPSFAKADGGYWAAELANADRQNGIEKDIVAEYVFINAKAATVNTKVDFFADSHDALTITTVVDNGIMYYVISGGYVNGKAADLYVLADDETSYKDSELLDALVDLSTARTVNSKKAYVNGFGVLKVVELTDDFVVYDSTITDVAVASVKKSLDGETPVLFAKELSKRFDDAVAGMSAASTNVGGFVVADEFTLVNCANDLTDIDEIIEDYQSGNKAEYGRVFVVFSQGEREKKVVEIFIASPEDPAPVTPAPKYNFVVKSVKMDSENGAEIVLSLLRDGQPVKGTTPVHECNVVIYNAEGVQVYASTLGSDDLSAEGSADDTVTIKALHTLTAGQKYRAVVDLVVGNTKVSGSVATNFYEAQTSVGE